jgi:hypothetical protein
MRFLILLALVACVSAVESPAEVMAALNAKHKAETTAAAKAWIAGADVSPIAVPKLGPDPRQSERQAAQDAEMASQLVNTLGQWKERIAKGDKAAEVALYDWFRSIEPTNGQVAAYMKLRGGPSPSVATKAKP